jgi:integrase
VRAEQARLEAQRLRGLIATGETPTGMATKQTEVVTVAELGQRYLDEYAVTHKKVAAGKTAKDEKAKHQGRRIVRGGEIVANRVQALLSKMFTLAEDWKLRPEGSNPGRGVKRYAGHTVERFLSADELARLGAALASDAAMAVQRSPSSGTSGQRRLTGTRAEPIAALRLLLLTGCRVGEVLSLRWAM